MTWTLKVDSPYSGEVVFEAPLLRGSAVADRVGRARRAQRAVAALSLDERIAICNRWIAAFEARSDEFARDLTLQMGKPLPESAGEIRTMIDRAKSLIAMAPEALADDVLSPKEGFFRKIAKEPVGVVLAIAAWNYPYLIGANSVVSGFLAGNAVLLKHSERTPKCGDAFAETFAAAGAPTDAIQSIHCTHDVTAQIVRHPDVDYVSFTGSVAGGRAVHQAAAGLLKPVATELGGKDAAYLRADADLDFTVANIVGGACYNAGQSCCAVERIYVHESIYESVVERCVAEVKKLVMGDPLVAGTTLGPLAQPNHTDYLASQVLDAQRKGGRLLYGGRATQVNSRGRFFEPTVIAECDHMMSVMVDESFGPIVALAPVNSDEEASQLINDSFFGLTASIWTRDEDAAMAMAPGLKVGTVFTNRADFLDPELPWSGHKDTGRGVSLSRHGFGPLTRLKGYHFRRL
ncbi:MAG: acyl-CoA reductase-like NAD-dependent aldehyde dehydrogenase [Myxococcota bacterium]|jgi:acyl-CoA reductase-like NAD-dependent aldehyde dehydrogenase